MQITFEVLRRFAGNHADAHMLQAIADHADALARYRIVSAAELQAFFATLALESGGFTQREENLSYSAKRLCAVWPKRFPTLAAAQPYAHNPRALAEKVYGGRMGNRAAGDAYKYRGRGPGQITGRDGYAALGKVVGLDLVVCPELVSSDAHLLECVAAFWQSKGMAAKVAAGPRAVRRAWNGGLVGFEDFELWLAKARRVFTTPLSTARAQGLIAQGDDDDQADDGDDGADRYRKPDDEDADDDDTPAPAAEPSARQVERVQRRLRDLGYYGVGNPDGDMAALTRGAIVAFKHDNELEPETPEIDAALLAALSTAQPRQVSAARANATAQGLAAKNTTVWAIAKDKLVKLVAAIGAGITGLISYIGEQFHDTWEKLGAFRDALSQVPLWAWLGIAGGILLAGFELSRRAERDTVEKYRRGELQ